MARALLILLVATSCVRGGGSYRCGTDTECSIGGVSGICEPVGYCSFPDPACENGYRFGEHSGEYANDCVTASSSGEVTIGGTVSNLLGSNLVLRNNGGDDLLITASGPFTFDNTVMSGVPYEVTVAAQPSNPQQTCAVLMGAGTAGMENVTDVTVDCATTTYTIGGTVVGLLGTGMVITNNGGDDKPITANGTFTFTTSVASGTSFNIAIKTQPSGPAQTCSVSGGTGTVGSANISSVVINCNAGTFTVGGTVSGLQGSVVLSNNGTDSATVSANGSFAFPMPLATSATYDVTVATQPTYPPRSQTCVVTNGTGTIAAENVTSVAVACTTSSFTVGGSVSGLSGTLVLMNGTEMLDVTGATFTFATPVLSGNTYNVTIATQPSGQTCVLTSGATGTVTNNNVTNVVIACSVAGSDPGILCDTVYCDPAAGQICCIDGGVATCTTSCSGNKTPIRCDTQADCAAAGTPALVCCGTPGTNVIYNTYCGGQQQCMPPDAFFCDPNVTNPCPNGGTCTPTMYPFPGYYRCF